MTSQSEKRCETTCRRSIQLGGATKRAVGVAEVQGGVAKGEIREAQEPVLVAIFVSVITNHANVADQTRVMVQSCFRGEVRRTLRLER
jgi:hypothetical protein